MKNIKNNSLFIQNENLWEWKFVRGFGFLSFVKNIGKDIGRNISKNLRSKYSQKLLDHAKQSATDGLETNTKN